MRLRLASDTEILLSEVLFNDHTRKMIKGKVAIFIEKKPNESLLSAFTKEDIMPLFDIFHCSLSEGILSFVDQSTIAHLALPLDLDAKYKKDVLRIVPKSTR